MDKVAQMLFAMFAALCPEDYANEIAKIITPLTEEAEENGTSLRTFQWILKQSASKMSGTDSLPEPIEKRYGTGLKVTMASECTT